MPLENMRKDWEDFRQESYRDCIALSVPESSEEQEVGMVGLRMQDMAVDVMWG